MSDQNSGFRTERDSLGEMRVPADALYGPQTQRAVENFPISGIRFPRRFIPALGTIKKACAAANMELGRLEAPVADAIVRAADEVIGDSWTTRSCWTSSRPGAAPRAT